MNRNFNDWLSGFRDSIASYSYYVDFNKIYKNVEKLRVELNILNSLVGSKNIEEDFEKILTKYPEVLPCIPLLLAVRSREIFIKDENDELFYDFRTMNYDVEMYKKFMRKTGLFDLLKNHIINNLIDYALGIETGLDSNGRKNRGGHLMEDLVENYIKKAGFKRDINYFKEMSSNEIERKWGINLSNLSNNGQARKKFDFVVNVKENIYAIETNFYAASGSKLNETARSYKMLAKESEEIDNFYFVWFTDGKGWKKTKGNLKEAFDSIEHIYNINEIEENIMKTIFV